MGDIVCSAWQHAAVHKRTGEGVASLLEHKVLFGAGGNKLSRYILGINDYDFGMELKEKFLEANPKLAELVDSLVQTYRNSFMSRDPNRRGYIPAIDGRPVYLDSEHKALNYLLQSDEAITCQAALLYIVNKLAEEKIWYEPRVFYHDELQVVCRVKDVARVKEIMVEGFREAPKDYGIMIMDGDAKHGKSWLDTH